MPRTRRRGHEPRPRTATRDIESHRAISSRRTGIRRDELATLAEIGALNAFGHDRRSALWQIERAVRPAGELFEEADARTADRRPEPGRGSRIAGSGSDRPPPCSDDAAERLMADYAGTSLTIGPHPMALRRAELALRGVLRAQRSAARPPRPAGARRRRGDHAAAAGHGQGVRVPDARGRNRDRQHHRPAGSLHRAARRHHRRSPTCWSKAPCRSRKG